MADEHVFIAHRCGYAVHFGKQGANDWGFSCTALNGLAQWLLRGPSAPTSFPVAQAPSGSVEGFWDYYSRHTESPWLLLHDRDFGKTWTTPSGYLFSDVDYVSGTSVVGPNEGSGIFRVVFLTPRARSAR